MDSDSDNQMSEEVMQFYYQSDLVRVRDTIPLLVKDIPVWDQLFVAREKFNEIIALSTRVKRHLPWEPILFIECRLFEIHDACNLASQQGIDHIWSQQEVKRGGSPTRSLFETNTRWSCMSLMESLFSLRSILAIALIFCMASSGKHFDISSHFIEVIVLNDSNFEELTQMTTGSTTGSWFVKFYAPVEDWWN